MPGTSLLASAQDRVIPVVGALQPLLAEGGFTRGHTVGCQGGASLSLALAAVAHASAGGAWVAAAGLPDLGAQAAKEAGLALERLVVVTSPHEILESAWANVVSALIDGFDLVLLRQSSRCRLRSGTTRRLQARLQARGAVMIIVGDPGDFSVDVTLSSDVGEWEGIGQGFGRLSRRRLTVAAGGRRLPRVRYADLWLPHDGGAIQAVCASASTSASETVVVPLRRTG